LSNADEAADWAQQIARLLGYTSDLTPELKVALGELTDAAKVSKLLKVAAMAT
jgi:anti-sigma regulatory factor (Ser/Thr protein kinase)